MAPPIRHACLAFACAALLTGSGCGFGTIGVAAGTGGGSSSANAPATPTGLVVLDARTSPARIRIELSDAESNPALVDFGFRLAAANEVRQITQMAQNPISLTTQPTGTAHELTWDFALEPGLGPYFTAGVTLFARVAGGPDQTTVTSLGNDAPSLELQPVPAEVRGIVALPFTISDSSDDLVSVKVEYRTERIANSQWVLARPAGLASGNPTPTFAFTGIAAAAQGSGFVFFWDTDQDLTDLERQVRVRFTPSDPTSSGLSVATSAFTVDNNDEPLVQIEEGALLSRPDRLLGIPIPYRVVDDEGDPVSVLFQWRLASQNEFPPLGLDDPLALAELLRDPGFVRDKQICTPFATAARGYAQPVDSEHIRLPELARGDHAEAVAAPVVGRRIELMRPRHAAPTPLASTWNTNPLTAPAAVISSRQGDAALVLDEVAGNADLREVDLRTGETLRLLSGLAGKPTAMSLLHRENLAFVATDQGGHWRVFEIGLRTLTATLRLERPTNGPAGPLEGLAVRGANSVLATAGTAVLDIDWTRATPVIAIADGFAAPRGIVLDPVRRDLVYVADRMAATPQGLGRIVAIDLQRHTRYALPGLPYASPEPVAMTFGRRPDRLHVLCRPTGLGRAVAVALNIGTTAPGATYELDGDARSLAAGPDGQLLCAVRSPANLTIQGGVEQRRAIVAFDPATAIATVAPPFTHQPRAAQQWRLRVLDPFFDPKPGSAAGTPGTFVWDSGNAPSGAGVFLQAIAVDSEFGFSDRTTGDLIPSSTLDRNPGQLIVGPSTNAVAVADLDGDGDTDLVAASDSPSGGVLKVITQTAPGAFVETATLGTGVSGVPDDVAVADVDGDGRADIVGAFAQLAVFFQDSTGSFTAPPVLVGCGLPIARRVVLADLDGDGLTDLVSGHSTLVAIAHQLAPRVFPAAPLQFPAAGEATDVIVADFDGDARLDVISGTDGSSAGAIHRVEVLRQSAPRTYTAEVPEVFIRAVSTIDAADVDGDGRTDLLVGVGDTEGGLFVRTGAAATSFQLRLPNVTTDLTDITAADVDGDGDLDILGTNRGSDRVIVVHQLGDGVFSRTPLELGGPGVTDAPSGLRTGDVDGDGLLDIVTANRGGGSITILSQEASQRFSSSAETLGGPATTFIPAVLAAGDFDGNGRLDLVTTNEVGFSTFLVFFEQQGNGQFLAALQSNFLGANLLTRMTAADLDADGDTDLAHANAFGGLDLTRQEPAGQFTTTALVSGPASQEMLRAGDLDSDGDLDLAYAENQNIKLLFQQPNGSFAAGPQPLLGREGMCIADLDGDGDLDIACRAPGGVDVRIRILLQTSPGTFAAHPTAATAAGTAPFDGPAIAPGDLDDDGDIDLVVGSDTDTTLLFQIAPGEFGDAIVIPGGPNSIAVADFDGDGRQDFAAAFASHMRIFRQVGRGLFTPMPVALPEALDNLITADFDGDGRPDLAATRRVDSVVRVFSGAR